MNTYSTLEEPARYLKVSKQTIYRYCDRGKLPYFTMADEGCRRFKKEDLDALLVPGGPRGREVS